MNTEDKTSVTSNLPETIRIPPPAYASQVHQDDASVPKQVLVSIPYSQAQNIGAQILQQANEQPQDSEQQEEVAEEELVKSRACSPVKLSLICVFLIMIFAMIILLFYFHK